MALILADRVRETSTTTGSGTLTLAGAVTGYQTFLAGIGNANTCYYAISNPGIAEWEVGIGTYTTAGNTLTRTTVLKSSNANAAVVFTAGSKDVFVTYPAGKSVYLDASGNASGLGTPAAFIATNVTGLPISTGVSGLGTGVATALAVNVGTAGASVVNGGVLGTPSSGTLTNCTFPTLNQNTSGTAAGLSVTLVATSGGTGQSTVTTGDLLYGSAANTWSKLADVATGNALISGGVGVAPSWGKVGLTTHISGTLPVANGGTNITAYTIGDIIYASTAGVLSSLADVATGNAIISGGVGVAPSYGKIGLTTHVSGTLPVANGGTGITALGTNVATALGVNVGTAGAFVVNGGVLGTPSSGTLTNCTFPTLNQNTSGTAAGLSATLAVASGGTGVTTSTGTGSVVLSTSPTLVTPILGTPTSGNLSNCTGVSGTAKAWVQFSGATPTINGSFNVSSITRVSLGIFTVNFTTALANANYAYTVSVSPNAGYVNNPGSIVCNANGATGALISPTTSAFTFTCYNLGASNYIDPVQVNVIVLG